MTEAMTFHNKGTLKIQAQIFTGYTLMGACLVGPGEVRTILAEPASYDIYFKNGDTGWEVARQLNSEAKNFTLNQSQGRYTIT